MNKQESNQSDIVQAPTSTNEKSSKVSALLHNSTALIVVVVLSVAIVASIVYWQSSRDNSPKTTNVSITEGLEAYNHVSKTPGLGFSFQKPKDLTVVKTDEHAVLLNKTTSTGQSTKTIMTLSSASVPKNLSNSPTLGLASSLVSIAANSQTGSSKTYSIKGPSGITASYQFSNQKSFSSSYIKSDAKQSDFTYTRTKSGEVLESRKGKFLAITTPKAYYYFAASSPDADWSAYQQLWNTILDNIKVDQ